MTERLYQDAYCKTFAAHIVERLTHDSHPMVALDRTAFIPPEVASPMTGASWAIDTLKIRRISDNVYRTVLLLELVATCPPGRRGRLRQQASG